MEVELVFRSTGNLVKGGNGSIFHEVPLIYKMAALLFYHYIPLSQLRVKILQLNDVFLCKFSAISMGGKEIILLFSPQLIDTYLNFKMPKVME
jgi:hypothetical protein